MADLRARLIGIAGAVVFAGLALASGLDRISAQDTSLAASVPGPFQVNAARVLANDAIVRQQLHQAMLYAGKAVARDPMSADSVSLLAQTLLLSGKAEEARRAFQVSESHGWRDPPTQVYWMLQALERRDWPEASRRLDAVLRQAPRFDQRNELLKLFEAWPDGREQLARRLAAEPSWKQPYFQDLDELPDISLHMRGDVAKRLGSMGEKERDCDLIAPLLWSMPDLLGYPETRDVWASHCSAPDDTPYLVDPGFERTRLARPRSPFDWRFAARGEIDVTLAPADGFAGKAITVSSTAPGRRRFAQQPILLPPGEYTMTWRAMNSEGMPATGLTVSIECSPEAFRPLSAAILDSAKGRFSADFSVAATCDPQWLALAIRPGLEPVTIDDFAIASKVRVPRAN
ncbi:MAG: hypothetical protein KDE55_05495 [Novosphingobium sp.]|nr:hypothetical protein [Novosphingobium sp.]